MPTFKPYTLPALDRALAQLEAACYTPLRKLDIAAWWSREPLPFAERQRGEPRRPALGEAWGSLFDCAWFLFSGEIPAEAAGQHVVLLLDVNGELCVVDDQGEPLRGLTNRASEFDYRLGRPGKRVLEISARATGGEPIAVWADAGCNDLFGRVQEGGIIQLAHIATCDDTVLALFYDFEVLLDFLKCLPANTPRAQQILAGLSDVTNLISGGIAANASAARERLASLLAQRGGDPSLTISAIGHAHMDLAWLWPIRETIRKGARTFATALAQIERYPDYVFGASQPQYFQWMREHYPGLYERIRAQVRAGRIEPQGAMWVEADTNIAGGEALARQLLLGIRFFEQEFGVRCTYLWLPDVFGYSAALPQLLRLAGLRYFSTQKLSWSEINTFPHHSFHWQGIDGSRVLAHMLPEETYNGPALPRSVAKIEQNYKDSGVSGHSLMVFGIGDGGGGPGEEHLERLARIRNLAGLSPVRQRSVAGFFEDWQADSDRFATWVGELYLERHQGTYTTQARNKRANRQAELALRALEIAALSDVLWAGGAYPAEQLDLIWREVLLYQFHDILPGSSIKRVYDESLPRYESMLAELRERTNAHLARLAAQANTRGMRAPVLVWNALSWARSEWLVHDNRWLQVTVPPLGYAVVDAATQTNEDAWGTLVATPELLENDVLRVRFGGDGAITSVYDKRAGREVLAEGEPANRLAVYHDAGDAWDIPFDYAEQPVRHMVLVASEARREGPRAIMTQTYRIGNSELRQQIVLTTGSARLDFETTLRWREARTMLRTSFPLAIHADEATFEIQFGHVRRPTHRNTTWDLARDEVSAHKWADLSQRDYGVALLNDSKYGHKIKGHTLDLNLLRSVPHPGSVVAGEPAPGEPDERMTDQCDHQFTYALFPHAGDHITGGVIQAAYALNVPLLAIAASAQGGSLPASASLLTVDAPNVIVEAVKRAEDGDDLIVRLYESEGRGSRARVQFGPTLRAAAEATLLEEAQTALDVSENGVALQFRPFEIKTLRVTVE